MSIRNGMRFSLLALLAISGFAANAQNASPREDPRVLQFARYANQEVQRLGGYTTRSVGVHTGTNRGGAITAYFDGTALKCLTATIHFAGHDDVTRFIFGPGRVWAIDIFEMPYDPVKKTLQKGKRRLKSRYLLLSTGTRYVMHAKNGSYRKITEAERTLLDDIMTSLPRYRALLAGRKVD